MAERVPTVPTPDERRHFEMMQRHGISLYFRVHGPKTLPDELHPDLQGLPRRVKNGRTFFKVSIDTYCSPGTFVDVFEYGGLEMTRHALPEKLVFPEGAQETLRVA